MISKIFQSTTKEKIDKGNFVAFVNERDFMGTLISKKNPKNPFKIHMKRNSTLKDYLNRTSQQFFFDIEFERRVKKLSKIQDENKQKSFIIEPRIDECFQSLSKYNSVLKNRVQGQFYIDLKRNIDDRLSNIKSSILSRLKNSKNYNKNSGNWNSRNSSKINIRTQSADSQTIKQKNCYQQSRIVHSKNKQNFMINFAQLGKKNRNLIIQKKVDPWKSWYKKQKIQIFPGEIIEFKKLQKSIF